MKRPMTRKRRKSRLAGPFLLFGLLLTLILILVISTVGRQRFGAPHKLLLELVGSLQLTATEITESCRIIWQDYLALVDVRQENIRLKHEITELQDKNNEFREAHATNIQLRKLLDFKETLPPPTLTASIVGIDPSLWFRTIVVNRGSSDGVEEGMPVATAGGIVGQVLNTSPHYAKILLANDPNSAIDALVQRTRVPGIIKGTGDNAFQLHYVLKNSDVEKGDQVVTSETGGVFPKGLLIGTVTNIIKEQRGMFQHVEVTPAIDFTSIENVIIILKKSSLEE